MAVSLEERVAYLEGKVEEHTRAWRELKEHIMHLEHSMNERFDLIERRFEGIDKRFEGMERRFEGMDRRIDALREDMNQRFEDVNQRINALDQKFSRYFLWTIGIQISVLLTLIAVLLR